MAAKVSTPIASLPSSVNRGPRHGKQVHDIFENIIASAKTEMANLNEIPKFGNCKGFSLINCHPSTNDSITALAYVNDFIPFVATVGPIFGKNSWQRLSKDVVVPCTHK